MESTLEPSAQSTRYPRPGTPFFISCFLFFISLPSLADAPIVTVAMDAKEVADDAYKKLGLLTLQRKLALRLTQAGYGVVAPEKKPAVRLLFTASDGKLLKLEARAAGSKGLAAEVPRGDGKEEIFHLEVIHRAVALVRRAARSLPREAPRPASLPASVPASAPTSVPAKGKGEGKGEGRGKGRGEGEGEGALGPRPWTLELAGGAMALFRPGGVDPMVRGSGRIGIWRGLGLRGNVGVSLSLPDDGVIVELAFQVGASWRFQLTRSLHLEPGLLVGVAQHIYDLDPNDGAYDNLSGLRWGLITNLTAELGWRLHRRLALRLWVSPGAALPETPHLLGGADLWRRSWFRLEAGLMGVLILR